MRIGTFLVIVRSSDSGRYGRRLSSLLPIALVLAATDLLVAQTTAEHLAVKVSGRVLNARTGGPMARVLVQANGYRSFTNGEGRFQFTDSAGIRNLQFTKPGFSLSPEQRDPETVAINAPGAEASLEVELWPEAVLTGTVTSPEGDPLSHITVSAQRHLFQNGTRQMLPSGFTQTDEHGSFRIPVPAGSYVLQTRYAAPDFTRTQAVLPTQIPSRATEDSTGTIAIASGQELHFDLRAQLATASHVTLPVDGSVAARNPSITVTTAAGATYQPPRRVTFGGMELDLPAGVYQLSARLPAPDGDRVGHMILTVPDHDSVSPTLHLDPVPSLPVFVTADPAAYASTSGSVPSPPDASGLNLQLEPSGANLPESNDQIIRIRGRGAAGSLFMAPPGAYLLSGGESAGWTVVSATYGGVDLLRRPFAVGPNVGAEPIRVVVDRANGSISGVTLRDGVPAGCWIVFVSGDGTLPHFFVRRSAASGDFDVSGLPSKEFHLLALPLLSTVNFADPTVLGQFQTYVQTVTITSSSAAALRLEAVPVHELYP